MSFTWPDASLRGAGLAKVLLTLGIFEAGSDDFLIVLCPGYIRPVGLTANVVLIFRSCPSLAMD